jgi:sigma-B regulation protein RsbU (phosphoserine phosphatase)
MTGGPILGCLEGIDYQSKMIRLEPGERFMLFTDGVTEAFDKEDKPFGEERLEQYLKENTGNSTEELVKGISAMVNEYSAGVPQSDDITLLAICYNGNK